MKFEIIEERNNKLSIQYDKVFEETICALMNWDKLTEYRFQYLINEAMYDFVKKHGSPKKKK